MQGPSLFEIFAVPLIEGGIRFCITGSVAAIIYSEPRLTHDIDLVIDLEHTEDIEALPRLFPSNDFYLPPEEIIRIERSRERRGHFNVIHFESGYKADFYLVGTDLL